MCAPSDTNIGWDLSYIPDRFEYSYGRRCIRPYRKVGRQCLFFSRPEPAWDIGEGWEGAYLSFYDAVAVCRKHGGDLAEKVLAVAVATFAVAVSMVAVAAVVVFMTAGSINAVAVVVVVSITVAVVVAIVTVVMAVAVVVAIVIVVGMVIVAILAAVITVSAVVVVVVVAVANATTLRISSSILFLFDFPPGGGLFRSAAPLLSTSRRLRPQPAVARLTLLPVVPAGRVRGGGALQEVGRHHEVHLRDGRLQEKEEEEEEEEEEVDGAKVT